MLELPVSVNPLIPIPLSAAWMRNLGTRWTKVGVRANFKLGRPVVFYVHPRDVISLPRINGVPSHVYRNTGDHVLEMLSDLIGYVKEIGGVFWRAIDLAGFSIKALKRRR